MAPEVSELLNGGGLAIAAFAAYQAAKLVTALAGFLRKLEDTWKAEEKHREAEVEHWKKIAQLLTPWQAQTKMPA